MAFLQNPDQIGVNILLWSMVVGIVLIKILWVRTEAKYFNHRVNFTMLKTNAIEALILALQILVVYYLPLPKTPFDGLFVVAGIAMYVLGIILALWARGSMMHFWGIPGEHASVSQNKLVTEGAFRISRNPIYVGFAFIYIGFCIAIKSWLVILRIPLLVYFYKSALKEEKLLEKSFGEKYLAYKTRVPRFLLMF